MSQKFGELLTPPFLISVLVIGVISCVAIWLLLRWRERNKDDNKSPQSYLKDFEEMRLGGDLTDAEIRNIRTSLDGKKAAPPTSHDVQASLDSGHG